MPFALFRVLWSVISGCMARSIVNALVSISLSFYGIRMRVAKACCEAEDLPSLYESPEEKLIVISSLYLAMPTTSARAQAGSCGSLGSSRVHRRRILSRRSYCSCLSFSSSKLFMLRQVLNLYSSLILQYSKHGRSSA